MKQGVKLDVGIADGAPSATSGAPDKENGFRPLSSEVLGVIARGGGISTRLALYPIILASWIDFEHANQR